MAEAFRILAEHFAEKDNINVTLSDKGEAYSIPKEKRIVLPDDVPDEMFGVTLATLLHESYHLKCSDPSCRGSAHTDKGGPLDFIINVLEDIRIDTQILKKYPNAKNLYSDLVEYIFSKKKEAFDACPKEVKILKEFILKSYSNGPEFERFFSQDGEIKKFFEDNKIQVANILHDAAKAPTTKDLEPIAKSLMKLVFPTWKADFMKQFNGNEAMKQAKEAFEEAESEYNDGMKDFQPIFQEQNNINNTKRKATKDIKVLEASVESYENWIKQNETDPNMQEHIQYYKDKIKLNKERIEQLKKRQEELEKQWKEFRKKHSSKEVNAKKAEMEQKAKAMNDKYKEKYTLEYEMRDKEALADKELSKLLSNLNKFSTSFSNIDKNDFIITEKITQTLAERLKEFLKNKQERRVVADEGKISSNKLPTYFDPMSLFEQRPEDLHKKTRVFFVVDKSGSMDEYLPNDSDGTKKHKAVSNALDMVFKVLDSAIKDEGLDIEYSLYAFNEQAHLVKDFEQEIMDKKAIHEAIYPCGGTDPRGVLEEIENVFCDDINTKEVVIFMTDGDFGGLGYEKLESLLLGRKKWIFLGMGIKTDYNESRRIFGRYNVTQVKDIQKVLTNAIEDAI